MVSNQIVIEDTEKHIVYKERWHVLLTVASLNIGINTLLYSYSPVAVDAAQYFEKEPDDINNFTTIGLVCSLIVSLVATWLVEHIGLRYTVLLAGSLCFCGGFVRMLSTFPGLNESIDPDVQYWLTMFAQAMNGMANPLAFCLPTKVAVEWFPENEAPLGAGLITMSFVLGLAIATGITPIFFAEPDLIEWMNVAWFIPSAIAFLCSIFLVRADRPPTPPSHSAAHKHENHVKLSLWTKLKKLFKNRNFIVLIITVGGVIGYTNALISTLPQITCSVGYTSEFTGVCVTLLLFCGVIGGTASSFLYRHTGKVEEQAKVSYAIMSILTIPLLYLLVTPDEDIILAFFFAISGLVGLGLMPLGSELALENTYPLDPAAGLSLIFCFSMLIGISIIELADFLVTDLSEEDMELQVCVTDKGGIFEPKNHDNYIIFLMVLVSTFSIIFIIFLKTEYRRRNVDILGKSKSAPVLGQHKTSVASLSSVVGDAIGNGNHLTLTIDSKLPHSKSTPNF